MYPSVAVDDLLSFFLRILLSDKLELFVSKYSEHWHDTWASSRFSSGWVCGVAYSEQMKQHPMLKPYRSLTEKVCSVTSINLNKIHLENLFK